MVALLVDLVREPSVSGSDCETEIPARLARAQFASGRLPADSALLTHLRAAHGAVTGGAPQGCGGRAMAATCGCSPRPGSRRCSTDPAMPLSPTGPASRYRWRRWRPPLGEVATAARALAVLALQVCGTA